MNPHAWISHSPDQTLALGAALAKALTPGSCLALNGPLGSGKTQFVKGVAQGLGVPASEPVVSPTFVLMREYAGDAILYHLDTYRLANADELIDLGFEELLDSGGVVAVEWADRTPEVIPADAWRLRFEHQDETARKITLQRDPDLEKPLCDALDRIAQPTEPGAIDNPETPPDTTP